MPISYHRQQAAPAPAVSVENGSTAGASIPREELSSGEPRRDRLAPVLLLAVLDAVGEAGDGAEAGAEAAAAQDQGGIDGALVVVAVDHRQREVADGRADVVGFDGELAAGGRVGIKGED